MEQCKPTILEPVMLIEMNYVPEEYMGAVDRRFGFLNVGAGLGSGIRRKIQIIKAQVPLGEMSRYSIDLRSIVHGKGFFTMRFSHYAEAPPDIIKKIIETSDRKPHAAEEESNWGISPNLCSIVSIYQKHSYSVTSERNMLGLSLL